MVSSHFDVIISKTNPVARNMQQVWLFFANFKIELLRCYSLDSLLTVGIL